MKKHLIRDRRSRYGGIAVALAVLVVAVTVLANAVFDTLAKRYYWYSYMLADVSYGVTDTCFELLEDVFAETPDAKAEIIFCDLEENLKEDQTMSLLHQTVSELVARFPQHLTMNCYDIWTDPTKVKNYLTTVDPTTGETIELGLKSDSLIIVSEGYHRVYEFKDFFSFSDASSTDTIWAYNGERKIAAGILRAVEKDLPVACVTTNHGEVFYDYELLYLLDDAGYSLQYINLYTDEIPENCTLLISYNPNSDLVDDGISAVSEIDILDEFLAEDGNSFWVLMENGTPSLPNFERYLASWGVAFDYYTDVASGNSFRYMVQECALSLTSDGYTIYGDVVSSGKSAEILEGLSRKVVFKNATSMRAAQGFLNNGDGSFTNGARTMYSLYESGEGAVAWANGKPVSGDGSILMSLTEQKNATGSSYVGVLSSVDFSALEFLQSAVYGNSDAMFRCFEYAGRSFTPEGITLKPFASQDISTITTTQMLQWTIGLSVTPAVVVLVVAVAVLIKRRRA
ncbi:MAG: Gldg family protein [Clostridia bacterium]|nr:Gldg family protein [Clostridia bacterium]